MAVPRDVFSTLPPMPYPAVRPLVRDGDLLLCSADDAGSRLIRWATRSPWSHCAIAFRLPHIDRVLALECVETIGVRAVPVSDFIRRTSNGTQPYPGRILLARHAGVAAFADHALMRRMSAFAFDRLGNKFSNQETARIGLRIAAARMGARIPGRLQPRDEMICSEYVAGCYASVGLPIPWDGLGFVAPDDIAEDPAVSAVVQVATR